MSTATQSMTVPELAKLYKVRKMPQNQSVTYRLCNYKEVFRRGTNGKMVRVIETAGVWALPTFYMVPIPDGNGEETQLYYRKRKVPGKEGKMEEVLDRHDIQFRNGTFIVEAGDTNRYNFLEMSPDFEGNPLRPANRTPLFRRIEEEKEIDKSLEGVEKVHEAFTLIDKMEVSDILELASALNIDTKAYYEEAKPGPGRKRKEPKESAELEYIKKKLKAYASKTPDRFKQIANDPLRKFLAVVVDAQRFKAIAFNSLTLSWCWKNGTDLKPITKPVPAGVDHVKWFAGWLSSEDNITTLHQIKELVDTSIGFQAEE